MRFGAQSRPKTAAQEPALRLPSGWRILSYRKSLSLAISELTESFAKRRRLFDAFAADAGMI